MNLVNTRIFAGFISIDTIEQTMTLTEGDLSMLDDRIIECICRKLDHKVITFHGVDMIRECAKGFLDKARADKFQFTGEDSIYKVALERFYQPLAKHSFIQENENNNFTIPADSKLHEICRKELTGKEYINWKDFTSKYLT
jgi:hypothetical protein